MTPDHRRPWLHLVLAFFAITGAMLGFSEPGRSMFDLGWFLVAASGAYNAVLFGVAWECKRQQRPGPVLERPEHEGAAGR